MPVYVHVCVRTCLWACVCPTDSPLQANKPAVLASKSVPFLGPTHHSPLIFWVALQNPSPYHGFWHRFLLFYLGICIPGMVSRVSKLVRALKFGLEMRVTLCLHWLSGLCPAELSSGSSCEATAGTWKIKNLGCGGGHLRLYTMKREMFLLLISRLSNAFRKSLFSPHPTPCLHLFVLLSFHSEARKQDNAELYEREKKNRDWNNNMQQNVLGNGEVLFVA